MVWIIRMVFRGLVLLIAALGLRACENAPYALDARWAAPMVDVAIIAARSSA